MTAAEGVGVGRLVPGSSSSTAPATPANNGSGSERYGVDQKDALDFVRVRWPNKVDVQSRINKAVEELGEVMGAWVKMHDGTGRKTLADLRQETAQLSICVKALAEAAGFNLAEAEAEEWLLCNVRIWPEAPTHNQECQA